MDPSMEVEMQARTDCVGSRIGDGSWRPAPRGRPRHHAACSWGRPAPRAGAPGSRTLQGPPSAGRGSGASRRGRRSGGAGRGCGEAVLWRAPSGADGGGGMSRGTGGRSPGGADGAGRMSRLARKGRGAPLFFSLLITQGHKGYFKLGL